MNRTLFGLLAAAALVSSGPAYAHHSGAAYFSDKTQTIEGTIVEFVFRNPHSSVDVEAPDERGVMQRWAVEWAGGRVLDLDGVTAKTLHAGDHVIIAGNPNRNPEEHRLHMRTISRPKDGWKWGGAFDAFRASH